MKLEGRYMSVSEIADKYPLSKTQVRRLAEKGKLPGAHQVGRTWLIPIEAIEAYLANRPKSGRPRKGGKQ